MNAKQLCVVSIAVAATFAAFAPLASACGDCAAIRQVRDAAHLIANGRGSGPTHIGGMARRAPDVVIGWRHWY